MPIVVYDLPDRDCAAKASNGEFSIADNGQANYENYIDQIVAQIQSKLPSGSSDLELLPNFNCSRLQSSLMSASLRSSSPTLSPTWSQT